MPKITFPTKPARVELGSLPALEALELRLTRLIAKERSSEDYWLGEQKRVLKLAREYAEEGRRDRQAEMIRMAEQKGRAAAKPAMLAAELERELAALKEVK